MFCDCSKLVRLYKLGKVYFRLLDTNDFHANGKNERFNAVDSEPNKNSRHRLADYVKNCTKKRPAREARLFVLIQPIISLIRGVVISGAVAIS